MAKKGSNVPEKPKTPQQLWYNHEKKAFLKTHPDVSSTTSADSCTLLQWSCGILRVLIFFVWHQATTKDIKDSLGKQWTQLSDKKRLKWITKSLEQRKQYEVTAGSCGRILTSDDDFHLSVVVFICFFPHSRRQCGSTSSSIPS